MAGKSAFDPKNILQSTVEHRGLLEELNVPPKAIAYIRENQRLIQVILICVVAAILAWSAFDHYQETKRDKSVAMLAKAVKEKDMEQQAVLIGELQDAYPGTDAALLGKVELGHIAFQKGDFDEAIANYSAALDKMSSDNDFLPLVEYSLAQAYEGKNDIENAIKHYQSLTQLAGFNAEGYQALGRIYENQGQIDKAIEAYQNALEKEVLAPEAQEMIEGKLARLK